MKPKLKPIFRNSDDAREWEAAERLGEEQKQNETEDMNNTLESRMDPVAEIFRTTYAAPKQELKDGSTVAQYLGWNGGGKDHPGFPLFNLTKQIGIYPVGSTVTEPTLNRLGYTAPDIYASRSFDDNGEPLC
jgi:hypothetical protein